MYLRQFYSTPPNILLGGISVGWPLWTWNGWDGSHLSPSQTPTNQPSRFLPDPGVSGVRSMGPGVSMSLHPSGSFLKLCWCDSGWWWYQLNTIDDANLKRSLAIRNQCHICKSHTSWWSKQNCRNSGGKMKYNSKYQKYGDTKIRNTTSWVL